MKRAILLISVGLVASAAIGYMIYDARRRKSVIVTPEFMADDEAMYTLMRSELITHLNGGYGGWFDDEIRDFYAAGASIGGKASKTAAFMKAYDRYKGGSDYAGKSNRFQTLYTNLKKRYQ